MSKFCQLLVAVMVAMFVSAGVEAQAQTPLQLKANGFGKGNKNVVFMPGPTVPYTDIYVGQPVTFPVRAKGEGPQLAPTRVFVGENQVNPASAGTFLAPSPNQNYLRVYWVPSLLPEDVQGPGFGRADLEGFYGADGGYNAQFYIPRYNGFWVRYPLAAFATPEVRTTVMKSEFWTRFLAAQKKAKADFEKKAEEEKKDDDDKKKDEGDDKKPADESDDKKKDEGDDKKPESDKE